MARKSNSSNGSTKQSSDAEENPQDGTEPIASESAEAAEPGESSDTETNEQDGSEDAGDTNEAATSGPDSDETGANRGDEIIEAEVVEVDDDSAAADTADEAADTADEVAPPPPTVVAEAPRRSGAFGAMFGGLVAGAIGFLAATFLVPEGWPNGATGDSEDVSAAVSAQSERLDSVSSELAAIKKTLDSAPDTEQGDDVTALIQAMAATEAQVGEIATSVETQLVDLQGRLTAFEDRLAVLEARPVGPTTPDGSAAMEAQLEAFRSQLDDVTADAEARIAEAQERASEIEAAAAAAQVQAERDAALSSLKTAMDDGTPFTETLAAFPDAPEDLKAVASDGVPTLSQLQTSYASAARSAISSSKTVAEDASTGEKFAAFLRRQTNARSLAPREGTSADAVLSRAEAALASGDLKATLNELSALPETAKVAMSDWIASAEMRAAALASVAKLESPTN